MNFYLLKFWITMGNAQECNWTTFWMEELVWRKEPVYFWGCGSLDYSTKIVFPKNFVWMVSIIDSTDSLSCQLKLSLHTLYMLGSSFFSIKYHYLSINSLEKAIMHENSTFHYFSTNKFKQRVYETNCFNSQQLVSP